VVVDREDVLKEPRSVVGRAVAVREDARGRVAREAQFFVNSLFIFLELCNAKRFDGGVNKHDLL
jgi:hypothetical protein